MRIIIRRDVSDEPETKTGGRRGIESPRERPERVPRSTRGLSPGRLGRAVESSPAPRGVKKGSSGPRTGCRPRTMADVFYRAPGADAFDLWSGDSHDPRDVHSAYEAMSRQEQDLAAARRRAAAHAAARRYEPRLRRLSSGNRSPYGSPGSRRLAPGEARRRDAAATRIQRIWRGGLGRSVATDRWVAVFQIQRFWRGALGRRRARAARRAKKARDEAEARAEEIDDITASVRARRERRTPALPLAFDEKNERDGQRMDNVRFTPKKKIDWDAEPFGRPFSAEEDEKREKTKNAARFTDSAFFETETASRETPNGKTSLSSFATHRASDETFTQTTSTRSLSASMASPASGTASSEHQSLFDEMDAVLLNAKLARRRLLGKSPLNASVEGGTSSKRLVAPSFGGGREGGGSPSSDLSNDYQHWYSDDASPASIEKTPSGAESRARFFRSEFAELASSSAASSVDGDAHEKRERMSRYAAALASASGGVQRGNPSKGVRIRTELLPPTRPVSARRSPSPPRRHPPPFKVQTNKSLERRASLEPSTRDSRATPAMIKARYEASRLEEERAFEEQMKTLRRKEREANARAAAAAEAAEAAAFLAASPGPGPRESFPSLDDTAGSLGDLDLRPGRVPTGIGRSPSQSPSTRRPAARASPKDTKKVLPLWDGFS